MTGFTKNRSFSILNDMTTDANFPATLYFKSWPGSDKIYDMPIKTFSGIDEFMSCIILDTINDEDVINVFVDERDERSGIMYNGKLYRTIDELQWLQRKLSMLDIEDALENLDK